MPRRGPSELSYGSSGVGSVFHLMGELFNQTAGVRIKHVPYRGVAPAMQDVVGGHIPMVFISVSNALRRRSRRAASRSSRCSSPRAMRGCRHPLDVGSAARRSASRRHGSASSGPPGCRARSSRG